MTTRHSGLSSFSCAYFIHKLDEDCGAVKCLDASGVYVTVLQVDSHARGKRALVTLGGRAAYALLRPSLLVSTFRAESASAWRCRERYLRSRRPRRLSPLEFISLGRVGARRDSERSLTTHLRRTGLVGKRRIDESPKSCRLARNLQHLYYFFSSRPIFNS